MADRRDPNDPLGRKQRDTRSQIRLYLAGAAALAALILIVQNSQKVEFNFFFASAQTPLFFGLLIAFVLGALVGWLLPRVRGSRNRSDSKRD
ncbi:MAG: LapA family protein [Solirubrobacterales bacterium]|nr:LapA family protein [Solirubrobacterales bacterium]MCB8969395.1 LapA family protein [Thermoleophilales bacterium]MCO5327347.1 LapA family protein [Solirubrobacterales bacterium]